MRYAIPVPSGKKLQLADIDPDQDGGLEKEQGFTRFQELDTELDQLQEELFAAGVHSVLAVFQGMDTSGKDGAIRTVFASCNPQGMQVASFKVPTEAELAHDFLWRVHKVVPGKGMIGIFNRSHYEDVLVVRVHNLVPEAVWSKRYDQINQFESLLAANGTLIMKFFLHISNQEQEQRLLEREQDLEKAWKLSAGDWRERGHWDAYQEAYEAALTKCNTEHAPWYIIPANRKWYRNLAVAEVLVETLKNQRDTWKKRLEKLSSERKAELAEYRKTVKQ
jgi:PPK2 family polyphosphate:nucleotide phosphotransferase